LRAERKATLILITHDERLAHRCERVIRLRDGLVESIEPGQAVAPLRVVAGKDVQ
jgi:putative ABC transport system ATP-binding protein